MKLKNGWKAETAQDGYSYLTFGFDLHPKKYCTCRYNIKIPIPFMRWSHGIYWRKGKEGVKFY